MLGKAVAVVIALAVSAQMSVDEAQRRLHQKLSTRPATTQPASDDDRLRQENTRLREENLGLREEVASLREAIAHATDAKAAAGAGATRPAAAAASALQGKWRGGNLAAKTSFVTEFTAEGTYRQEFLSPPRTDTGRYQFISDDTVEMWTDQSPADAPHHRWRVESAEGVLTLTPVALDGSTKGNSVILKREP